MPSICAICSGVSSTDQAALPATSRMTASWASAASSKEPAYSGSVAISSTSTLKTCWIVMRYQLRSLFISR